MKTTAPDRAAAKHVLVRGLVLAAAAILVSALAVGTLPWLMGGVAVAVALQSLFLLALGAVLSRSGASGATTRWLLAAQPGFFQLTYAVVLGGAAANFFVWGRETHSYLWWSLGGFLGFLALLAGGTAVYLWRRQNYE